MMPSFTDRYHGDHGMDQWLGDSPASIKAASGRPAESGVPGSAQPESSDGSPLVGRDPKSENEAVSAVELDWFDAESRRLDELRSAAEELSRRSGHLWPTSQSASEHNSGGDPPAAEKQESTQ